MAELLQMGKSLKIFQNCQVCITAKKQLPRSRATEKQIPKTAEKQTAKKQIAQLQGSLGISFVVLVVLVLIFLSDQS